MAKLNVTAEAEKVYTHPGAEAYPHLKPIDVLRRSVMACMLWENQFYEDGASISDRIKEYAQKVTPEQLAGLAIEARHTMNLRHVPLLLTSVLATRLRGVRSNIVEDTVASVVARADELAELLLVHGEVTGTPRKEINKVVTAKMKKGLARAFTKFDAYQLGKYNRDGIIKLRDVLFLSHAKPLNVEQSSLWKKLVDGSLESPETWEVLLSQGADKQETFTRLISEGKLGYLALLRNLRNMEQSGVSPGLIRAAILARKGAKRVLPFRFVAAARAVPKFEPEIDEALLANVSEVPKQAGKTIVILDMSGSMSANISLKSGMTRADAAAALGAIAREVYEDVAVYATAGDDWRRKHATALVPSRRGMALVDAVQHMTGTIGAGGIFLKQVIDYVQEKEKSAERIIVITDEADCSHGHADSPAMAKPFGKHNYLINVASYKNGIGYGPKWTHIDGFSENVLRYIHETEREDQGQ